MRLLNFFLALLVMACAGCATTSVPANYVPSDQSGNGVVITSITYGGRYSGYSVLYSSIDKKNSGSFTVGKGMVLIPYFPAMDFEEKGMKGDVIVAELPAGEYEINGWNVSSGYATIRPASPVQIRFTVEPGKRLYLGNFHFEQTRRMGLTVTGVKVAFNDLEVRDMKVVAKKFLGVANVTTGGTVLPRVNIDDLGGGGNTTMAIPYIPLSPLK